MEKLGKEIKLPFRAPAELVQKFDTLAKKEGYSRSAFFRRALKKLLYDIQKDERVIYEVRKLPYVGYRNYEHMKQFTISLRSNEDYYLYQHVQELSIKYDMSFSMIVRCALVYMLKQYDLVR
jgi:hypothetical protein